MIELKNISYHYPDSTAAIADICFSVTEGEKLVVAGANGAEWYIETPKGRILF